MDSTTITDEVYRALLGASFLADWHRARLRARGLSDEQIDFRGYRSDDPMAVQRIAGQFDRATLLSVPGFILQRGWLKLNVAAGGTLVPCRDVQGRIRALKVRQDFGQPRYLYVSSRPHGPGPGAPVHVPLGVRGPIDRVRITEGELKSDVATVLNCTPTVSVPGVGQWRAALPLIEELGAKTIVVAFDSDAKTNPIVARHQLNFAEHLNNAGLTVEIETWDGPKGIDDLLLDGGASTLHVGPAALWKCREIAKGAGADLSQPETPQRIVRPTVAKATTEAGSTFTKAKSTLKLAQILTDALGPAVGKRWKCRCGGKISIRRDQLGVERMYCWSCRKSEDAPGFIGWHYGLTFRESCERLGLPVGAKQEPAEAPVEEKTPVFSLRSCPYRTNGVLLRKKGESDIDSVHPPCGNRITCEPCRLSWQAEYRARFRLGLKSIEDGTLYKAVIDPEEWKATRERLRRFAKREKVELCYAAVEHDTEAGERRLLVISNLVCLFDSVTRPVKHETASGVWCEALKCAAIDVRNPASFSRTWPSTEAEPSDYERIGEIEADPEAVRSVAGLWGFESLDQIWSKDRIVCLVQGFDSDPRIALIEQFGFKASAEEYHANGLEDALLAISFTRRMAIPFVQRCIKYQEQRANSTVNDNIASNSAEDSGPVQLDLFRKST